MKIKKKEAVIPFRETLPYRMGLLAASIILSLFALYQAIIAFRLDNLVGFGIAGALAVAGILGTFYNLGHLGDVRLPKRTAQRMKRR
jgi:hypothetical protein